MLPTSVFWPREFHELYSPWVCKESDATEQMFFMLLDDGPISFFCLFEHQVIPVP